jgi:hypothetical protein
MRCSYYPQSLAQIRGAIREIGSWIWGSSPAGVVHPESPGHTGLTSASYWSDRCRPQLGFCLCERLGEFAVVPCCCCFEFGSFWSSVGLFGRFGVSWLEPVRPVSYTGLTGVGAVLWKFPGFTSRTGLTGGAHRPDRCKSVRLEVCVPLCSRVREVGCWFLGPVALQWLCGLGQLG